MPPENAYAGTVLVADDDKGMRDLLVTILSREGFKVIAASDGLQAVEAFRDLDIDVGLVDVMMPRHNGFDVCRIVKSRQVTRFTPIVLVTGLADATDRVRGIQAGADDFISKPIQRVELIARVRSLIRLKRMTDELEQVESMLISLALTIGARDPYTTGHSERVSQFSLGLGAHLGLSEKDCVVLGRGGFLHDIGKIKIPDSVLWKQGPLDEDERRLMEEHPLVGERICMPFRSFKDVLPIIRWHHERLDGGGYPDRLKGNQIPLLVRIIQVADIFDSLVSARPYRRGLTPDEAFTMMRSEVRKGWWDGMLIEELERLLQNWSPLPRVEPRTESIKYAEDSSKAS